MFFGHFQSKIIFSCQPSIQHTKTMEFGISVIHIFLELKNSRFQSGAVLEVTKTG